MRRSLEGQCEHCSATFAYELFHAGFSELAYAYCDRCGQTALLDGWSSQVPANAPVAWHEAITPALEPWLEPCSCGGHFRAAASPRCPTCIQELSPVAAADWIEPNAPGTAAGWRWQRGWSGLYCIVIEGRSVKDPWRRVRDPAAEA